MGQIVVGKEEGRKRDRKESDARAEIKGDDGENGVGACGGGRTRGWKKQRLGAKVASAGETSEYGDAEADIEESRGRYRAWCAGGRSGEEVYANIFPTPAENRGSLSHHVAIAPIEAAVPSFPSLVAFLLSIARFSRRFFFLCLPLLFISLSLSLIRRV